MTVRVPWIVGTQATAPPRPPKPPRDLAADCERKVAGVQADVGHLERVLAGLPKGVDPRAREALEQAIAFQRRRIAWLQTAAQAPREDVEARLRELGAELGEEGLAYLRDGLPGRLARDQRFLDLLGEASILSFVLEG
jgi:hypothetical protein